MTRHRATPERRRQYNLRFRYGIEVADYDRLFRQQGGKCAIASCTETENLHLDHDHTTGKIRGLLCRSHNLALGYFHDRIIELCDGIDYLKSCENS